MFFETQCILYVTFMWLLVIWRIWLKFSGSLYLAQLGGNYILVVMRISSTLVGKVGMLSTRCLSAKVPTFCLHCTFNPRPLLIMLIIVSVYCWLRCSEQYAVQYCVECQQCYCEQCSVCHTRTKSTSDHALVLLGRPLDVDSLLTKLGTSTCHVHTAEDISLYCFDCDAAICYVCYARSLHLQAICYSDPYCQASCLCLCLCVCCLCLLYSSCSTPVVVHRVAYQYNVIGSENFTVLPVRVVS